ncbi:putative lipid II flippase FtsW [Kineothrix sp. MSJ-39]|nr:putative lipid II flippase FtsW [Kineothrix sp. MSJ-39]
MLYSTSSYEATLDFGNGAYYLRKQAMATVLGLVMMLFISVVDYHVWRRFALPAYLVSLVLVVLVKTPLGYEANGARRWIKIAGISLQPAEVVKITLILLLASVICIMGKQVRTLKGIAIVMGAAMIPAAMILLITKNMSSAIIIAGIAAVMLFVADPHYKRYILIALAVVGVAALAVLVIVNAAKGGDTSTGGFRGTRILAWLNPEAYSDDKGFQTLQALYAIGSGGLWGKGLGQSMQKLGFLPEAQNDMVFSIICEELGLFGAFCVILLFVMLLWRMMVIANNAPDLFGALLVVGVMGHFAIQVVLNIAVVTNSIPNTGITLPFISYGGTSILFLMSEVGLVLNVSKSIRLRDVG